MIDLISLFVVGVIWGVVVRKALKVMRDLEPTYREKDMPSSVLRS